MKRNEGNLADRDDDGRGERGASADDDDNGVDSPSGSGISSEAAVAAKRQSFASIRGSTSEAELSVRSDPAVRGGSFVMQPRRRVTITGPGRANDVAIGLEYEDIGPVYGGGGANHPRRRQSRYKSIRASGISNMTDESSASALSNRSAGSGPAGIFQSIRARTPFSSSSTLSSAASSSSTPRRSLLASRRLGKTMVPMVGGIGADAAMSMDGTQDTTGGIDIVAAADRLGDNEQNLNWESAAAAAAVVAATAQATPTRNYIQFRTDEHVLVLLKILNLTNRQDDRAQYTVDPVNKYGYPLGEGKAERERQGPYSYVLCSVCKVHFDEDERYYTIRRADTGTEQRADPGWMEPIHGEGALEAAFNAALRTERSEAQSPGQTAEQAGACNCLVDAVSWPMNFARKRLVPCYRSSRAATKELLEHMLRGSKGYACRFKLSFVNALVLCSFIYLLIEPFTVAFLPASLDFGAAVTEL